MVGLFIRVHSRSLGFSQASQWFVGFIPVHLRSLRRAKRSPSSLGLSLGHTVSPMGSRDRLGLLWHAYVSSGSFVLA